MIYGFGYFKKYSDNSICTFRNNRMFGFDVKWNEEMEKC